MAKFSFFSSTKKKNNTETDKEVTTKNSIERLNESIDKISDIEDGYLKKKSKNFVPDNSKDATYKKEDNKETRDYEKDHVYDTEDSNKFHFIKSDKYFSILIYALAFVLCSILIFKLIGNLAITFKVISQLFKLIGPFITGGFIALVLYPLVKTLYNKVFTETFHIKSAKLKKVLAIIIAYLIAIGFVVILLGFVIPQIYLSLQEIIDKLPIWYDNAYNYIITFENNHSYWTFVDFKEVNDYIQSLYPRILDYLSNIVTNMVPYIFNTSMLIVKGLVNFIIAIIVSVYMISDHRNLFYQSKRVLYGILPKKSADSVRVIVRNSVSIFLDFIFGKALDSLIIGILCFIIMTIFRMPYSVLISVIVGVTNMIPYFGPYIGGVIGGLFIIITNIFLVIPYAIMILVIQQLDGLVIGPKIIGDSIGLKPLWVIFGITVGGSLWGVAGMFLGVPIVAVLGYIIDLIVQHFLNKKDVNVKPYDSFDEI